MDFSRASNSPWPAPALARDGVRPYNWLTNFLHGRTDGRPRLEAVCPIPKVVTPNSKMHVALLGPVFGPGAVVAQATKIMKVLQLQGSIFLQFIQYILIRRHVA